MTSKSDLLSQPERRNDNLLKSEERKIDRQKEKRKKEKKNH